MPLDGAPTSPLPLPDGWSLAERVDDVVRVDDLSIRRVGLCATSANGQAAGSAADVDEDPTPRATFELLERIALAESSTGPERAFRLRSPSGDKRGAVSKADVFPSSEAPDRWAFARSNGVSLHTNWTTACQSAAAELVERDRLLRAWLGETLPVRIGNGAAAAILLGTSSYDWRTYLFPAPEAPVVGSELDVVGVFGFPQGGTAPLVFGFGSRPDRDEAIRSAQREALQLLAFLWGEPIPEREPDPVPAPMTHLETYQMRDRHAVLLHWLEKGHAEHHRARPPAIDTALRFADLTPPWLEGHLHVAKALCPAAVPLVFGHSPLLAHLPPALRIHPIP